MGQKYACPVRPVRTKLRLRHTTKREFADAILAPSRARKTRSKEGMLKTTQPQETTDFQHPDKPSGSAITLLFDANQTERRCGTVAGHTPDAAHCS